MNKCEDYQVSINKIYSKDGNTIIELYCNDCGENHDVVYKFVHDNCRYCDKDKVGTYYSTEKEILFDHSPTCSKRDEEEFIE